MKESVIYQEILEEGIELGIEKGLRMVIILQGEKILGPADSSVRSRLDAIGKAQVLEDLLDRLLAGRFATWNELLGSAK